MTQFYILSKSYGESDFAYLDNEEAGTELPPSVCPECGEELALSPDGPEATYSIKGNKRGDLISDGISIALSARCVKGYLKSGLIGLDIRQAPLRLTNSNAEFFLATPKATCTRLDELSSGVVIHAIRGCPRCRVISIDKIDRAVIDIKTWGGEDIFCCGNLFSAIIASDRFVEFVTVNKFTNFTFIKSNDFCFDYRRPL